MPRAARGALVAEETPVDAITRRAGGFTLRTSRGVVEAREVIVATNGYTGAVTPWLRRRLIPLGSYIIATEPLPPETARRLIPRGRMIVDTNRVLKLLPAVTGRDARALRRGAPVSVAQRRGRRRRVCTR